MTRQRLFRIGWAIFMIAWVVKTRAWEGNWRAAAIGLIIGFGIMFIVQFANDAGKKLNVGEARFNSRTGKVLKPGEKNI